MKNMIAFRLFKFVVAATIVARCFSADMLSAGVITDGEFSAWTSTPVVVSGDAGSGALIASGGNPGANYANSITNNGFFNVNYVANIKTDYTFSGALTGTPFTLNLDVLKDSGIGGSIGLAILQGGSLFISSDVYGAPGNTWTAEPTLNGTFNSGNFTRISGSGTLSFAGGIPTQFGFFQHDQQTAGTNSAFYDNFSLSATPLTPVPEPSTLVLGGFGTILLFLSMRRARTAQQ